MDSKTTLRDAILYFANFEHCRQFMMELRWPDGVVKCPHCGSTKISKKLSTFAAAMAGEKSSGQKSGGGHCCGGCCHGH